MNPAPRVTPASATLPPPPLALPYSSFLYWPFIRRVLVRGTLTWFVIRALLEGLARELDDPGLEPLSAAGLIAFVLVIEHLHARAVREVMFRANAGIGTPALLGLLAVLLVSLEALFRLVHPLAVLPVAALLRLWR